MAMPEDLIAIIAAQAIELLPFFILKCRVNIKDKPTNAKICGIQVWFVEFLLEINLNISIGKTGARLNLKIKLISLHSDPGVCFQVFTVNKTYY